MKKKISISIDSETIDKVAIAAKKDKRSLSSMCDVLINKGLQSDKID